MHPSGYDLHSIAFFLFQSTDFLFPNAHDMRGHWTLGFTELCDFHPTYISSFSYLQLWLTSTQNVS